MSIAKVLNQSMPLIPENRHQRNLSERRYQNESSKDKKGQIKGKGPYEKLPLLKISKILQKIGAGDRNKQMYIPNEEDQATFRKSKWQQLNREYSPRRYIVKPVFQGDLDEIVLDCWKFGQNNGRKTVWRKYRQNCDDLTFDTLKVMQKK